MKTEIVLHPSNLPKPYPLSGLATVFLLLAYFHTPDWSYGVFWTFVVLVTYGYMLNVRNRVEVDLFEPAKKVQEELE